MDIKVTYSNERVRDGQLESVATITEVDGQAVTWKGEKPITLAVLGYKDEAGRARMVDKRTRKLLAKLEKEKADEVPHPGMKSSETITLADDPADGG